MRTRWALFFAGAILAGTLVGAMLSPVPADAVNREMIQLQQQVAQLIQGQQNLQSAVDQHHAELKTLVEQSLDSVNKLNIAMGSLQKTVQDVQANTGARTDSLTQQVQGLSDNLQDVQSRIGKLSQQMTDLQGTLQSIDAKVSGGAPPATSPTGPGGAPEGSTQPPISSDTLYNNALRDFTSGKNELSRQEFSDYLRYFQATDLAGNAQFYLGEIDYAEGKYPEAIAEYDKVLVNFPKSFKLAPAMLKKAYAQLEIGQKSSATSTLREVVRRFPGTDEARRAQAKLRELGVRR